METNMNKQKTINIQHNQQQQQKKTKSENQPNSTKYNDNQHK